MTTTAKAPSDFENNMAELEAQIESFAGAEADRHGCFGTILFNASNEMCKACPEAAGCEATMQATRAAQIEEFDAEVEQGTIQAAIEADIADIADAKARKTTVEAEANDAANGADAAQEGAEDTKGTDDTAKKEKPARKPAKGNFKASAELEDLGEYMGVNLNAVRGNRKPKAGYAETICWGDMVKAILDAKPDNFKGVHGIVNDHADWPADLYAPAYHTAQKVLKNLAKQGVVSEWSVKNGVTWA